MSTVRDAVKLHTDPLTVRIYSAVAGTGKSVRLVSSLAGIEETTWRRRARSGDWRYSEAQAIAKALGVSFEWLIGLEEAA